MGYYIEAPSNFDKAAYLVAEHGATKFAGSWGDLPSDKIPVVVINNSLFEAAGVAYDEAEYKEFTDPEDWRSKTILALDKSKVVELCPEVAGRI